MSQALSLIDKIDSFSNNSLAIAHVSAEGRFTYRELKEKSDAIAEHIIKTYGKDKTPIIVFGHKQHNMLVCFLGCVKAGHAYIPIDSSFPKERIDEIIENSGSKLLINISNISLDKLKINEIDLEKLENIFMKSSGKHIDRSFYVKSGETYYIIYTSGSTGKPKGVKITLSCLESFVNWASKVSNCNANEVFLNQAPFSFDLSVMDLYLSLTSGSTLYSIEKQAVESLRLLFENLKESNTSIWVSTPSFAELCLGDSSFNNELMPNLKRMLFCGETLTNACVKKLHERFPNLKVVNMYGPTEATVAVTAMEITKEVLENTSPLPVGLVKEDSSILIVDRNGTVLPEGARGEIVIVGDSVSTGYHNNIEKTKKSFSLYPIEGVEKRCYKTGDEGYLKNGNLNYCGRVDFQIKLNGYRIELEDIENNFRKISIIESSVVIPVVKEGRVQYLAAVVVLSEKSEEKEFKTIMRIKNELKKFIPEYMVPRKIIIKAALPMTINGKVDRKSLMEEIK